jgi:hypothetical protein
MIPEKLRWPVNAKVRFTNDRLSVLTPPDRRQLEGRIGVVQGYWHETRKPTVYLPEEGNRVELRLLGVDPRHLELVEVPAPPTEAELQVTDDTGGNEKLSQSELDDLFG